METNIYSTEGKKAGTLNLPEAIFGLPWNADMMHQVVVSMQSNARHGNADTKDRSEVSGGGKKPWRQKGTGRARHGSSRSPIWRHGGVTHGPLAEKNYSKKINKKTRQKALLVALSQKFRDGKMLFVNDITAPATKTKEIATALKGLTSVEGFKTLTTRKANNILVVVPETNAQLRTAFRNLSYAFVDGIKHTNAVDVLRYRYILVARPEDVIARLQSDTKVEAKPKTEKAAPRSAKGKASAVKKLEKKAAPAKSKAVQGNTKKVAKKVGAKAK